ncbi:MAG: FAD-binding oxidoreductase, partial [Hydrogenophaga sp.]|nr:FAD-binding oxidoreductase [Hydrogenophaga sp.]
MRSLIGSDTQLNQKSYYEASVQREPLCPPLQGAVVADVVVVGGGFAGLSAALELAQKGMKVVLLEADRVGAGASGRNGGQAIVGYASGQGPFESQLGAADSKRAWDYSVEAIDLIEQRIALHGIACDWQRGYTYVADSARKAKALREEFDDHCARGVACDWAEGTEVARFIESPRYVAAFREHTSGHLHPLKYALGLARAAQAAGVQIHERSPVIGLDRGRTLVARTAQGQVTARYGVLA